MKTCLITGGCGFIGRHFTKKMTDLGYSATIVDNMVSKSALVPENWPKHLKCDFEFLNMDVLDYLKHTTASFDIIIHASAIVGGRETIENDPLLISYNITIDNELFRWIERNPVKHLVYFSSSAVYPISLQTFENHRKLKLDDIDVFNDNIAIPDLTYGWSKLTGEFLLSILSKRVDTTISIYRPFSGYGEDQHESYPFPSIMRKVLANTPSVDIWSDAVRDFVYIDDIVDYVLHTCFHDQKLRILNIGTGIATSMSDLAKSIARIALSKPFSGENAESNVAFPLEHRLLVGDLNAETRKCVDIRILDDKPKGVYYRVSTENTDYPWNSLDYGITKSLQSGLFD